MELKENKMLFTSKYDFDFLYNCNKDCETGLEFSLDRTYEEISFDKYNNCNAPLECKGLDNECIDVQLNKGDVPKAYLKVVEIYEMNEAEISIANKIRYILKLVVEGFFRNDGTRLMCAGIAYGFVTYDLLKENYLAALLMFAYSLFYTDIRKGFKTLKEYLDSTKRKKLELDLLVYGVLDYTKAMKSVDDVKMYLKKKGR